MKQLSNIRIRPKLICLFLFTGLLPLVGLGFGAGYLATEALTQKAFEQLEAVREIKHKQIEELEHKFRSDTGALIEVIQALRQNAFDQLAAVQELKKTELTAYIEEHVTDIRILAANPRLVEDFQQFLYAFENGRKVEETRDGAFADSSVREWLKQYAEAYEYPDVHLISAGGDVIFTAAEQDDPGTNLNRGDWKDSPLSKCFREAMKDRIVIQDFESYAPAEGRFTAFIASPVKRGENILGVIALQISPKTLNAIVQQREGMGKTGESYLVARHEDRISFRSDMLTMGDGKYVTGYDLTEIAPDYILKALDGNEGQEVFTDSQGRMVLVSYAPLGLKDLGWALISKIDLEEAIAPRIQGVEADLFTRYIRKYDYEDLYLIHPEGDIFYTVRRGADYRTDILNGKFKDSGFGQLVRKVREEKTFAFADFAPYPPFPNAPAAFVAQPLIFNEQAELIMALRFSPARINRIMLERTGMGRTGETYLVGPDFLMRSDAHLDPTNHSVAASFADPQKGKVETSAVKKAAGGGSGEGILLDYLGNSVLSSFSPVTIGGVTWALLAEIDESEVAEKISRLKYFIIFGALITGVIALALAGMISGGIVRSILSVGNGFRRIAEGDLTVSLPAESRDELGELAARFNRFSENLRATIHRILKQMDQLARAAEEMTRTAGSLDENAGKTTDRASDVSAATEELSTNISAIASATEEMSANAQGVSVTSEQMSQNMNAVASAVEEVSVTISGIAENARRSSEITAGARSMAVSAETAMDVLGAAAGEIGDVTQMIRKIAEQTNLLALNATIEAASAGDAGRGFAVVANEIKELAGQSARAAGDIASRIGGVQENTEATVGSITEITGIIREINTAVEAVSDSVEQLSQAAQEISENASQAGTGVGNIAETMADLAHGANDIARNVGEAAGGSSNISASIAGVSGSARKTGADAGRVRESAENLTRMAAEIRELLAQFRVDE